jgi:hypothetical protein
LRHFRYAGKTTVANNRFDMVVFPGGCDGGGSADRYSQQDYMFTVSTPIPDVIYRPAEIPA